MKTQHLNPVNIPCIVLKRVQTALSLSTYSLFRLSFSCFFFLELNKPFGDIAWATFEGITDIFDDGIGVVHGEALKDSRTYNEEDVVTHWTCYFGYTRKDEEGTEDREGKVVGTTAEVGI